MNNPATHLVIFNSCCTTGHQVKTLLLDTTNNPNTLRTSETISTFSVCSADSW